MSRPETLRPRLADPAAPPAPPGRAGTFAAFSVPQYGRLWLSGWLWNVTRWMSVFLCSYLVNQISGSPLLVQLVGAAFFAPMFVAGALGGVISDRFDRRRTILVQLVLLIPIAATMSVLVLSGAVRAWMVYPFMLAVGLGGVIDMTSRRALVWDFVGEDLVTNALALESLSMTAGNLLGTVVGGAVIDALGLGQAFCLIVLCYAGSFLCLLGVATPAHQRDQGERASFLAQLAGGFRLARGDRALVSILGVTVLMNVFFFSYTPLVPVFADRLGVDAFLAGVLAGASGLGSVLAGFWIASISPRRRGLLYVGGSLVACLALTVFAVAPWYPLAALALVVAGLGTSGFATMQSVLVMSTTSPALRGRALGILSMAIGTLPFGMVLLGLLAQRAGAPFAVSAGALTGLSLLLLWTAWRPEAQRLR